MAWIVISGLGGLLLAQTHRSPDTPFQPRHDDDFQGGWLALFALTALGLARAPCSGSPPRTSRSLANRTWSATSSGRSFFRWDSSPLCARQLAVFDCAVAGVLEKRSVLSALGESFGWESLHEQTGRDQPGAGHREAGADGCWPWFSRLRRCPSATNWAASDAYRCQQPRSSSIWSPTISSRWCGSKRFLNSGEYFAALQRLRLFRCCPCLILQIRLR